MPIGDAPERARPRTPNPPAQSGAQNGTHADAGLQLAQSKTKKEALRALKHRISDVIYRQLVADAQLEAGPGGQAGTTLTASVADPTPTVGASDKPQPGPAPNSTPLPKIA